MKWMSKAAAAVCLAVMLVAGPLAAAAAEAGQAIVVQGSAERLVEPDFAYVTVGVQNEAATVEAARAQNQAALQQVAAAALEAGIAKHQIQTSRLQLTPVYSEAGRAKRVISGYVMQHQLVVKVRDMDKLGEIIDVLLAAGANQLQGVRFAVENEQALQEGLLQDAVRDGQRKAAVVAEAGGKRLGGLLRATVGADPGVQTAETAQFRLLGSGAATPVFGGTLRAAIDVQLEFALQ